MPQSEGPYRVGQTVEVSYAARVAEVVSGIAGRGTLLRLEALGSQDYSSPPGGWLAPEKVNVRIVAEPLPTDPGMYLCSVGLAAQDGMGNYHADGCEFYYLTSEQRWVDIGWGQPDDSMVLKGPLVTQS
jgi:hypothetical protein